MAGVLHLLKDRGELTQRMQWAGRTNDMKPVMLQGLDEVYQSGAHSDEIANRVELALTRRDEYGRVLTPKQAFREVSYRWVPSDVASACCHQAVNRVDFLACAPGSICCGSQLKHACLICGHLSP